MTRSHIIPHDNDILLGRGGHNNRHAGNEKLRSLARELASQYRCSTKKRKSQLSRNLVKQVRCLDPPGRFLKSTLRKDDFLREWKDVGDDAAREKSSQVLRDAVAALDDSNVELHERKPTTIPHEDRAQIPLSGSPITCPSHNDPRGSNHEFQGYQGEITRYEQHHSDRYRVSSNPSHRGTSYGQERMFHHKPSGRKRQVNHLSHPALKRYSKAQETTHDPTITIISPEYSDHWRSVGYPHNSQWSSAHVHRGYQVATNWNGHAHQPLAHDYAYEYNKPEVESMQIFHNESWDLNLDPDDLSWISHDKHKSS